MSSSLLTVRPYALLLLPHASDWLLPNFVDGQPRFGFLSEINLEGTFLYYPLRNERGSMELNVGVIRDKPGIYSGLSQSRSTNQQLAICYNSDGKLLVKICTVKDIIRTDDDTTVSLISPDDERQTIEIPFDSILSIYPIRDFA